MAGSTGPNIVEDGLVLALDGANKKSYPSSGTSILDLSGNSNTGTLTNGPTFDSGNGGSILFDGVNDYVGFPQSLTNDNFTISSWVYVDSTGTANGILSWTVGTNRRELMILLGDVTIVYGNLKYRRGTSVPLSTWVNLTTTYDGTTPLVYSNGNSVSLGSQTDASSGLTNTMYVGRLAFSTAFYFDGKISTSLVYNRALTSQEILQNYNATKSRFI